MKIQFTSDVNTGSFTYQSGQDYDVDPAVAARYVAQGVATFSSGDGGSFLVSVDGITPARLTKVVALADAQPNAMPPELQPLDWWPDRFFAADAQYLYGHNSANALDFVRVDRASRARTLVANPFGTTAPRSLRTVWVSAAVPGLLLVPVGESSQSAASMVIHRSTDYGATWAPVLTLGTGAGGTINGIWCLSDRNICEVGGVLYLAEYNVNNARTAGGANDLLCIWQSTNQGQSWSVALRWNEGAHVVRHFHALKVAPDNRILILAGDTDAESAFILWDRVTNISNTAYSAMPVNIPVRYGTQRNRAVDADFRAGSIWWMGDGSTESTDSVSDMGWFKMPTDMSTPPQRLDGKISAVPKRAVYYTATFSTGACCYIEETTSTPAAGGFNLGIWTTNEDRTRIERNGVQQLLTTATGEIIPVMFQQGDTVFVSWSNSALGKATLGTASFTASTTRRWCGVRPDTIHPVYWVDPVAGTDDAASERGWRPSSPYKTLKYALESNRVMQGGRVLLPAGDFEETLTVSIALNADLTNAELGGYVTVEGAGINLTKHSASAASTQAQTYQLNGEANAGWEWKDIHLSSRRAVNTQAIFSGGGSTTAQRQRFIKARVGGKEAGATVQIVAFNTNLGAAGSITSLGYDSEFVAVTVGGEYLFAGSANGPHHFTGVRCVFDGGRGAFNPKAADIINLTDSLLTNYTVTGIRMAATASVVPIVKNGRFHSFAGLPQYIDDGSLTESGQWTAARCTSALSPTAIFDAASIVDATASPRDPKAFDYAAG